MTLALVLLLAVVALTRVARPRTPSGRRRGPRPAGVELGGVAMDPAVLLDLADAALASGASVPTALQGLGRALPQQGLGRGLEHAGALLLLGAPWDEAWQGTTATVSELRASLAPAWHDGVDPGPLLRRAASAVRARRARAAQEDAARLGVRLVLPLGLCLLPAFVLLALVPVLLSGGAALLGG